MIMDKWYDTIQRGYSDDIPFNFCLSREIVQRKQEIQWSDIKGNDDIKQLLYDTVVMPLNYPDLFKGIIKPWRTILMHGPSGTGKTLLARALCSEIHGRVTFFNVAASTVTSKWRGDSEKFVRVRVNI